MKQIPSEPFYRNVTHCRACDSTELFQVADYGVQPFANNLPVIRFDDEYEKEPMAPLRLVHCPRCTLVQLDCVVNPELLFNNYLYYSSTSPVFRKHFEDMADAFFKNAGLKRNDLVVDIGSNDGVLLKPFRERGAKVIGIEPCGEIAQKANAEGIETYNEYFNQDTAAAILAGHQQRAMLVTMTNVLAHVDNVKDIFEGVKTILHPDGVFMVEVPNLNTMLQDATFDLVYHEHLSYFTPKSLVRTANFHGLYMVNWEETDVHGGSIRMFFSATNRLVAFKEKLEPLDFYGFNERVKGNRKKIKNILSLIRRKKQIVEGYGSPAKASTYTNYYNIGTNDIDCIYEDAKEKVAHVTPGKHIEIVDSEVLFSRIKNEQMVPDYLFIFAWNFADSIITRVRAAGYKGKFILPYPEPHVI